MLEDAINRVVVAYLGAAAIVTGLGLIASV